MQVTTLLQTNNALHVKENESIWFLIRYFSFYEFKYHALKKRMKIRFYVFWFVLRSIMSVIYVTYSYCKQNRPFNKNGLKYSYLLLGEIIHLNPTEWKNAKVVATVCFLHGTSATLISSTIKGLVLWNIKSTASLLCGLFLFVSRVSSSHSVGEFNF